MTAKDVRAVQDERRGKYTAMPVAVAAGAALIVALGAGVKAKAFDAPAEPDMAALIESASGRLDTIGLGGVMARLDGAQLAVALRHDPALKTQALTGLTPGWQSLRLGGRPDPFAALQGVQAMRMNAAVPDDLSSGAAPVFRFIPAGNEDRRKALRCLTQAVYYEAALENDEGQAGVAQVVLNRVRDANYPSSICGVVYQGASRNTGCQFTFTCDGSLARAPVGWAWDRARRVAEKALAGHVADKVGTATHYHADYVRPYWAPTLTRITQVGAHIFYRWPGEAGSVASLSQRYSGQEPLINEALYAQPRIVLADTTDAAVTEAADNSAELARQLLGTGNREVEFEGTTRIVGAPSLGGRRQPTAKEISDINERLKAYEDGRPPVAPSAAPES